MNIYEHYMILMILKILLALGIQTHCNMMIRGLKIAFSEGGSDYPQKVIGSSGQCYSRLYFGREIHSIIMVSW